MNNNLSHVKDIYKSNLPYPPIQVLGPNPYYATLLKEDYVGMVSEMTAVTQYLYHSFVIDGSNEKISEMLENISFVEMHHLDILAQLIVLLGDKPVYYTQNSYWNGSYVDYGYDIYDQLNSDLQSEIRAIQNYELHIEMIQDPYIKEILRRIVVDEELHVKLFKEAIQSLEQPK